MLRSDLRALRNIARTRDGRTVLLGQAIVLACVALGSVAITSGTILQGPVLETMREDPSGRVVRMFYAVTLALPVLFAIAMGSGQFTAELYRAAQIPTLLTAPIGTPRIVGRAVWRAAFGWSLFAMAVGLPPILRLAGRTEVSAAPALVYPLAVGLLLLPVLTAQCLVKVVIVRWLSHPLLRRAWIAVNLAVLLGLSLWFVFGLDGGESLAARLAGVMERVSLPPLLDAPASLLAVASGAESPGPLLWWNLVLPCLALPMLLAAAALYRRSFESFEVVPSSGRSGRRVGRGWPEAGLASLMHKERLAAFRVRSNVVGYAVVLFLIVVILSQVSGSPTGETDRTPPELRQMFDVLLPWSGLMLLMATLSFLAVIGDEQRQISLLATAPLRRRTLLYSKLIGAVWPFLACYVAVALAAPSLTGASWGAVGLFAAAAPPIILFLAGLLLVVGTWPSFIRVHDSVPMANNLRSVVPVVVIGVAGSAAIWALIEAYYALVGCIHGHGWFGGADPWTVGLGLLGASWLVGCGTLGCGLVTGTRNLERMLGPQPE